MALTFLKIAVVYLFIGAAATTRLARLHFWLHNLGLPAFMLMLGLYLLGRESLVPAVAASAIVVSRAPESSP